MKQSLAIKRFHQADLHGRYVFNLRDLINLFPEDNRKTLQESLARLVKLDLLTHACRGIYVNHHARSFDSYVIERIAKALRRGEYNYVSLESMLSEYGLISQVPIDRITIMTTGRTGVYNTPYGVIEFTHTNRAADEIRNSIQRIPNRPLRVAKKEVAIRDLKRVGRNIHLIEKGIYNDKKR